MGSFVKFPGKGQNLWKPQNIIRAKYNLLKVKSSLIYAINEKNVILK